MNRNGAIAIVAGAVLFVVIAMRNKINLGLPNLLPASGKIAAFAVAIAKAEGFYVPNTIPAKSNNPGDLKVPGSAKTTPGGITIFESLEDGWSALYHQLEIIVTGRSAVYSLDMTIKQMGDKWAPAADKNQPGVWAQNVAAALGVPVTTPLRQVLT